MADLRRYYAGEIHIASDDIRALRFTIAFRTNQINDLFDTLPSQLLIEVVRDARGNITLMDNPGRWIWA